MQNSDFVSEMGRKGFEHLRRQRNLRNKQDSGLPFVQLFTDQVQVDGCLAAAGYAEKKRSLSLTAVCQSGNPCKGFLLLRIERGKRCKLADMSFRPAVNLAHAVFYQSGF